MPKAVVNKDLCISCGLCVATAPSVFTFDDNGQAEGGEIDDKAAAQDAIANCPVNAIAEE